MGSPYQVGFEPELWMDEEDFTDVLASKQWDEHSEKIESVLVCDVSGELRFYDGVLQQRYVIKATFKNPVCLRGSVFGTTSDFAKVWLDVPSFFSL